MVTQYAGEALLRAGYPAGLSQRLKHKSIGRTGYAGDRYRHRNHSYVTGFPMTQVMKQIGLFLAMIVVLVSVAVAQKSTTRETLRKAADPMGFWVGTTIQGRMWNRDPAYKPVMAREFNAGVSIVFSGPHRSRSAATSTSTHG